MRARAAGPRPPPPASAGRGRRRGLGVAVVDRQCVAVRVGEERLVTYTGVERRPLELHPTRLELGARNLEIVDVELDRVVVALELEPEGIRLHHRDREAAGLELDRGHFAPLLRPG
jgi:hypothetical protein